jgi:uncharacterized protein
MNLKTRDSFPDILRGFALFGIVLVNVPLLSIDVVNGASGADLSTTSGAVTAFLVMALAQAKFYLLFSFLFGYSAHYVIKGERANRGRFIARAIGLLILGLIHASFFFHGDILFVYGLLGLLLMALYFRKEGTIKLWTWVIYVLSGIIFSALASLVFVGERYGGKGFGEDAGTSGLDTALASGTFLEAAAARFEVWLSTGWIGILLQGPLVFVAFLVGVMAARKNLFAAGVVSRHQMKRLAIWGFTLGLPLQLWAAQIYTSNELGSDYSYGVLLGSFALNFFSAPVLSAGYVGLLWLVVDKLKNAKLLANAGRASLTVYLGQSLVLSFIFSAWGLGQFGKLGLMEVTLIAIATWLVLAVLMSLWFLRFQTGPMEKLLTGFSKAFSRKKS